jgi:hypothetical protein
MEENFNEIWKRKKEIPIQTWSINPSTTVGILQNLLAKYLTIVEKKAEKGIFSLRR